MRKLLTVHDVSAITGLAVQTLYNMRSTGGDAPKSFTLRGRVRYIEEDVQTWIENARGNST